MEPNANKGEKARAKTALEMTALIHVHTSMAYFICLHFMNQNYHIRSGVSRHLCLLNFRLTGTDLLGDQI